MRASHRTGSGSPPQPSRHPSGAPGHDPAVVGWRRSAAALTGAALLTAGTAVWLAGTGNPPKALRFSPTQRNLPFQQFLKDPSFEIAEDGLVRVDAVRFSQAHADDLSLFTLDAQPS